jgi:hypothetical protein
MTDSEMLIDLDGVRVPLVVSAQFDRTSPIKGGLGTGVSTCSLGDLVNNVDLLNTLASGLRRSARWEFDGSVLDVEQRRLCRSVGLTGPLEGPLSPEQYTELCDLAEILELTIDVDGVGDAFAWAYVMDPFGRIWQACMDEYIEGWFAVEGPYQEMLNRFRQVNLKPG